MGSEAKVINLLGKKQEKSPVVFQMEFRLQGNGVAYSVCGVSDSRRGKVAVAEVLEKVALSLRESSR